MHLYLAFFGFEVILTFGHNENDAYFFFSLCMLAYKMEELLGWVWIYIIEHKLNM